MFFSFSRGQPAGILGGGGRVAVAGLVPLHRRPGADEPEGSAEGSAGVREPG